MLAIFLPISFVFGMQVLLRVLALLRAGVRGEAFADALAGLASDPMSLGLVQLAVATTVLLPIALSPEGRASFFEVFAVAPVRKRALAALLVAGPALQVVLSEIENLARLVVPTPEEVLLAQRALLESEDPLHRLGLFFAIVLVAPLTEELLFRAVLQRVLGDWFPRAVGIALASVAFGLCHGPTFAAVVYAIAGGVVLALVFDRARSVAASVALHAAVNATPLLVPASLVRVPGFNGSVTEIEHVPFPLLAASVLVLGASLVAFSKLVDVEDPS